MDKKMLMIRGLQESGVPRESVFLATKMWPTDYGTESAIQAAKLSLTKLDTDYLGNLKTKRKNVQVVHTFSFPNGRSLHDALAALSQLSEWRPIHVGWCLERYGASAG